MSELKIRIIENQRQWTEFIANKALSSSFMQSWEWADFQKDELGKDVYMLGIYSGDDLVSVCSAISEQTRFGAFIECQRGPIISKDFVEEYPDVVKKIVSYFRNKGYIFIRIDPELHITESDIQEKLVRVGFIKAVSNFRPEIVWKLDISDQNEEDIMKGMRKNSRYSLRKGLKSKLHVRSSKSMDDLEGFVSMIYDLGEKKGFTPLSRSYYRSQFKSLSNDGVIRLYIAEYESQPIASALFGFYNGEVSYLHAATTGEHSKTQPAYVLVWKAIQDALELGYESINLWGVLDDDEYKPGHADFGFSSFKRGFGGELVKYIGTYEYPFNPIKYRMIRFIELYRKYRYKRY